LAFAIYLKEMMRHAGVRARFVRGGSTKYLVEMLKEGLTDYILDGQTFDLDGVLSMREDPRHQPTSPFTSYNYHGKGFFGTFVDVVVLGATEVDVNFNANVVTHSDGRLLHGIGGWQNCLFARCTILAVPAMRDRIPVIVDEVTTLTGPGELIDVVVTERGIAINPRRADLFDAVKGRGLPLRNIRDIQREVEGICGGKPRPPGRSDHVVAAVKWVDGTVLDSVWKIDDRSCR
jgi:citrate lyase subunit alpha / citrate CoA-transferase